MIDETTNKPIDALDTVRILKNSGAEERLAESDLQVTAITAQISEPRPEVGGDNAGM